jgi:DNA ligase (NAD+)
MNFILSSSCLNSPASSSERANTKYDIDGLVVKIDDISWQESLGLVNERPRGQIAWKFGAIKKETIINDVEWHLGNSGKITPIAILKPVQMGGVTVKRCSLHNVSIFNSFVLGKGDLVLVSRKNDVIPYLEEVIEHRSKEAFIPIMNCPSCGEKTRVDGKFLVCQNDDCNGASIGDLKKWVDKSGMKTLGVGPKTVQKLYESGLVKVPADFYRISVDDIMTLERQGQRSAQNIFDVINSKKELSLSEFIGALNIRNFSVSSTDLLICAGYDSLEKLLELVDRDSYYDLSRVNGIGEKTASSFVEGMKKKREQIRDLLTLITIKKREEVNMDSSLKGMSFCFTGAIERIDEKGERFTRDRVEQLVKDNGGITLPVKKGLNYLVMADPNSNSSKAQKAKKLGITIISEKQFFMMINM